MPKRKKKFNKKGALRFTVVQRSQEDPLSSDPNASRYVLQPVESLHNQDSFTSGQSKILSELPADQIQVADEFDYDDESFFNHDFGAEVDEKDRRLQNDNYEDNPYLRTVENVDGGTVIHTKDEDAVQAERMRSRQEFKSEEQVFRELGIETEGDFKLNQDDVQLLDADQVPGDYLRMFEEAEEFDGAAAGDLQDDFVVQAMTVDPDDEKANMNNIEEEEQYDVDEDFEDEPCDMDLDHAAPDERVARPIDEQFDRLLEEYDDEYIGDLDPEDPELLGAVEDLQLYDGMIDEFANRKQTAFIPNRQGEQTEDRKVKQLIKAEIAAKKYTKIQLEAMSDDEKEDADARIDAMFPEPVRDQWDVESIVTTYTNTENHPVIIKEPKPDPKKIIKLSRKSGIPLGVLPTRTRSIPEESFRPGDNLGKKRPSKETPEEKKARKLAQKNAKRNKRLAKKALKKAFTTQQQRLDKELSAQQLANPPGVKM